LLMLRRLLPAISPMRWSLSAHYGHFAQFGNGEYARFRPRRKCA
jgi:hypothetical protein